MKKRNTLVKKIAAALLASLFYTDTILLAASPILPDTKAPSDRQPLVQETASGIPLVNIAHLQLAESLAMTMSASTCPKKGPF